MCLGRSPNADAIELILVQKPSSRGQWNFLIFFYFCFQAASRRRHPGPRWPVMTCIRDESGARDGVPRRRLAAGTTSGLLDRPWQRLSTANGSGTKHLCGVLLARHSRVCLPSNVEWLVSRRNRSVTMSCCS